MNIALKRAYELPQREDGVRILVDRLWPRGLSRDSAGIELWLKDIAPSSSLRKWFSHDPSKWDEFRRRYFRELSENPEALRQLAIYLLQGRVTLVYGAKDQKYNNAAALKEYLERNFPEPAAF